MSNKRFLLLVTICCALVAAPADATFRGANEKLAHIFNDNGNVEILTSNPDGTARTNITNNPARDEQPKWSPDGSKIAFVSDRAGNRDIWVMNPDGSDPTPLTNHPAPDASLFFRDTSTPAWSPDGTKIAFTSDRDGDGGYELWVMDADGSNEFMLSDGPGSDLGPSWAPGSTQLTFTRTDGSGAPDSANVYRVDVDGTGLTLLTPEVGPRDSAAFWSPDGSTIAFQHAPDPGDRVWKMNPDGSGKEFVYPGSPLRGWEPAGQRLLVNPITTVDPDGTDARYWGRNHDFPPDSGAWHAYAGDIWSPDARYLAGSRQICFDDAPCGSSQIFVLDMTTDTLVELGRGTFPDWQPIPVNAYPRPKAASPVRVSLVPAYQPCTAPNRTHGPALQYASCNPPVRTAGQLTVGTPDANGRPPKSASEVILLPKVGIPSTPADEADIRLTGSVNDVRLASDLSDYTGSLEARVNVRITDKDNTPHPEAATAQDMTYSFPIPCSATADTTIGADCTFDTTAEAFMPGIAKEGRRAIWELGQLAIHDGAGNVFLRQGIFVP